MTEYILKNALVYTDSGFQKQDIFVSEGRVLCVCCKLCAEYTKSYDLTNKHIFPGFVDVHVHLREPGFSYKETIKTGTLAAARSGYTTVCTMPNLNPVPDSVEHLNEQLDIIEKDASVNVMPYGSITVGRNGSELSDMQSLADKVVAFSDDGSGIQTEEMMRQATACLTADIFIRVHMPKHTVIRESAQRASGNRLSETSDLPRRPAANTMSATSRRKKASTLSARQSTGA